MNCEAFVTLQNKYMEIVVNGLPEDIESARGPMRTWLNKHTGFGDTDQCSLCIAAKKLSSQSPLHQCHHCLWAFAEYPQYDINALGEYDGEGDRYIPYQLNCACIYTNTYEDIAYAKTKEELISALKKRVQEMNEIIKLYLNGQSRIEGTTK